MTGVRLYLVDGAHPTNPYNTKPEMTDQQKTAISSIMKIALKYNHIELSTYNLSRADPIMKRVFHPGHRHRFAVDDAWLIAKRFGSGD